MSKLHIDTHNTFSIKQAANDVIILYNDDGTKVIMVLENGRWLQARTDPTQKEVIKQPKKFDGKR